ncbi:S8 family peptidase [Pseudoxanthomonas sangjuensis]|uniref:S8 family peptidase n=1 Tax=Pseudoxanthomonas sangjuensis TaxID=1503750 RepID=UPI00139153DE|nr:S8 family peptidase [Pseudoxanthomonas sangjuensis]KAF1706330.1 peptidase S8 [Pseudoxanthomonas sangjuensis]
MSKSHKLHQRALASAMAVALTAGFAGSAVAAGRVDTAGLHSADQTSFDRFIVKYREGTPAAALQKNLASAGRASAKSLTVGRLRTLSVGAEVVQASRALDKVEAESLMRQIAADPNVEYVEVDRIMQPLMTPNDTHYATYLWGLQSSTAGIRADQAWNTTDGNGVVVAVLDTGYTDHSDLVGNILPGYDFISDKRIAGDGGGRDADAHDPGDYAKGQPSSWHGTHTAGTIGAVGNNNKGVIGVAYGAKVVPVRVLGRGGGYTSDIVDGITWASGGSVGGAPANANPAEVINMSLGGSSTCSSAYQSAIDAAVARGTTIVVAAGNSNADVSGFTPASCNNVIAVAALNKSGTRASYSNYGSKIDVAAPGGDSGDCTTLIVSTGNDGSKAPGAENYLCMAGTSMAAPHVAGVVALMQSVASTPLTPAQVESILKSTLRAFPGSNDKPIGNGIVDAAAAVSAAATH